MRSQFIVSSFNRWAMFGAMMLFVVVIGCQTTTMTTDGGASSETAVAESADIATNASPIKAGLYCGLGSRGVNSVYWAKILKDSPDVELVYLDGEDLRSGNGPADIDANMRGILLANGKSVQFLGMGEDNRAAYQQRSTEDHGEGIVAAGQRAQCPEGDGFYLLAGE